MRTKELREQRAKLVQDWRGILDKADAERRPLNAEERQKVTAIEADIDALKTTIDTAERLDAEERSGVPESVAANGQRTNIGQRLAAAVEFRANAFGKWFRGGQANITSEEREALGAYQSSTELRAQAMGTGTAGGYIVPQGFSMRLEKALKFWGGMFNAAELFDTETGADMPYPTVNDTAQTGALLAENATITAQDATFGTVTFKAYMYTSKLIAVSFQLMQDAAFGAENVVADLAGERLGRILNTHFTTGTGGGTQPNGIVTASASGKVGTTGQTTSVIYDDLVDLVYSIDPAYRPTSSWMMNDQSIKVVRKLKDSQNRPLWEPSVIAGQPDNLLGYPIIPNNDVAVMAANAKSILFGAMSKYKIRRVRDVVLLRLNERYADALQVGFFAFARYDGQLMDAGTNPVKYYQNSAT